MIIGTRWSKLAIAQTAKLCERLRARGLKYELKTVQSLGDLITDRGLYEMPSEGVFVKKLDMLLLDGKIDLAVHSMKDIPLEQMIGWRRPRFCRVIRHTTSWFRGTAWIRCPKVRI
jgi:hydroxymethylbilane synthase